MSQVSDRLSRKEQRERLDYLLPARGAHAYRHADLDGRNVGIDNVRRDFWTFFQGNDRDDVGGPFLEIGVIRFVENDKGADRSPT